MPVVAVERHTPANDALRNQVMAVGELLGDISPTSSANWRGFYATDWLMTHLFSQDFR